MRYNEENIVVNPIPNNYRPIPEEGLEPYISKIQELYSFLAAEEAHHFLFGRAYGRVPLWLEDNMKAIKEKVKALDKAEMCAAYYGDRANPDKSNWISVGLLEFYNKRSGWEHPYSGDALTKKGLK